MRRRDRIEGVDKRPEGGILELAEQDVFPFTW